MTEHSQRDEAFAPVGLADPPTPPKLRGPRLSLRPLLPPDCPALYAIALGEQINFRWRYRGAIPPYEAFVQGLHSDVLVQFVIARSKDDTPLGLVVAYGADLHNGIAYIAVVTAPEVHGTGLGMEPILLFVNYLYATWNLRNIYFEALEFNLTSYSSGLRRGLFRLEGRLVGFHYYAGRYWDKLIFVIDRERLLLYLTTNVAGLFD